MSDPYYTPTPEPAPAPVSNTEILLQQLIAEQGSNRRSINAIATQLKKDAEEREKTYLPVRLLCWVQIMFLVLGVIGWMLLFIAKHS